MTKESLSRAIRSWVEHDAAMRGGYLLVFDAVQGKALALTLDRVHEDRLSKVSENRYFACADFRDRDGTVYDVDVFMEGSDASHLRTTEVYVHKKAGVARYNWRENEDGTWERVSPDGVPLDRPTAAAHEHLSADGGGENH